MNQGTVKLMFSLIRSAICGEKLTEEDRILYSAEMLPELISLTNKHDVAHLVVHGLAENGLITDELKTKYTNFLMMAVYRVTKIDYELGQLCELFEKEKIAFIPLKGSVLRNFYPEPWMRTSCDIDVLVHIEDVDKATELLVLTGKYVCKGKGSHDVSIFSESDVHIELHYDLVEDDRANNSSELLRKVWEYSYLTAEKTCQYEMTDDMFYFYHIAHIAKHFENGGCGIRPFIDLCVLNKLSNIDKISRYALLEKGGLLQFAQRCEKLSNVWFYGETPDVVTEQMANYILNGGVYGSIENRVLVQNPKKGGKVKYLFSKIFLPYETIKYHYPKWGKHRFMTPLMNIRRWCKLIFCGHLKRVKREMTLNAGVTNDQAEQTKKFLKDIGL